MPRRHAKIAFVTAGIGYIVGYMACWAVLFWFDIPSLDKNFDGHVLLEVWLVRSLGAVALLLTVEALGNLFLIAILKIHDFNE